MGSHIELNDTLKISRERGFPHTQTLEDHIKNPEASEALLGKQFRFWNPGERLYNRPPVRVFLVEEIGSLWLYWGHAFILEQTINAGKTEGIFKITKIYPPEYQRLATDFESPSGRSYFGQNRPER